MILQPITNTIYDENGNAYTFDVTYTKTAADTYDMTYQLLDSTGAAVVGPTTAAVTFDPATGAMLTLGGAVPAPIGIVNAGLGINFTFDPTAVTQTANSNSLASNVDDNRDPTIVTGSVTIFDSLGSSHTLTLKFTKTSNNNWNWSTSVPSADGTLSGNTGTISFNPDGSINAISPNPPVVTFTPAGGASSQNIVLNLGDNFTGVTQTSSSSVVSALTQNGSSAASLSNINIDQYGYIVGVFSNGQSRQLAQILVATFPNLNGMISVGSVTRGDCGTANGFINFTDHEIRIRPDVDDLQACKTLAHEIGHSLTMTQKDAASVGAQRELREVEAESIALTWSRPPTTWTPASTPSTTSPAGPPRRPPPSTASRLSSPNRATGDRRRGTHLPHPHQARRPRTTTVDAVAEGLGVALGLAPENISDARVRSVGDLHAHAESRRARGGSKTDPARTRRRDCRTGRGARAQTGSGTCPTRDS